MVKYIIKNLILIIIAGFSLPLLFLVSSGLSKSMVKLRKFLQISNTIFYYFGDLSYLIPFEVSSIIRFI